MKAAPFDYVRVSALGHALTLGAACGLLVIASLWASTALAQSAPLLALDAPERAEKLLTGARKDGTLTLYTAFRPQDLPAIVEPFEAKYGIKVKAWRSGTNIVTQRVLREAAAKRHEVDVVMVPASDMLALSREKILQPVSSPHARERCGVSPWPLVGAKRPAGRRDFRNRLERSHRGPSGIGHHPDDQVGASHRRRRFALRSPKRRSLAIRSQGCPCCSSGRR